MAGVAAKAAVEHGGNNCNSSNVSSCTGGSSSSDSDGSSADIAWDTTYNNAIIKIAEVVKNLSFFMVGLEAESFINPVW